MVWSRLLDAPQTTDRFYGVLTATVTNNQDPNNWGRVKVQFTQFPNAYESDWVSVVTPMAGKDRGLYCLPEVDDLVLVAFGDGMLDQPYILGSLWNGADTPPESNSDGKNNIRTLKSRSGHTIRLDDTADKEKIEIIDASGANSIVIDTANNALTITADADITIKSNKGKLILGGKEVEITSQADVKVTAAQNMDLKAGPQLNVNGQMVNIN